MRLYYFIVGAIGIVVGLWAAQHFHMPWYWGTDAGFVPGTLISAALTLGRRRI